MTQEQELGYTKVALVFLLSLVVNLILFILS